MATHSPWGKKVHLEAQAGTVFIHHVTAMHNRRLAALRHVRVETNVEKGADHVLLTRSGFSSSRQSRVWAPCAGVAREFSSRMVEARLRRLPWRHFSFTHYFPIVFPRGAHEALYNHILTPGFSEGHCLLLHCTGRSLFGIDSASLESSFLFHFDHDRQQILSAHNGRLPHPGRGPTDAEAGI